MSLVRDLKALPREVWVLAIAVLINRSGAMVVYFISYYFRQPFFEYSLNRVAFVWTIFGIGALLTAYWSGRLSDRVGALRILKLSLVLSGAILLVYPWAQNFVLICFLTLLLSITAGAFVPASYAILGVISAGPDEKHTLERSKRAGTLYRLGVNLGVAVGVLIGGLLSDRGLWKAIFLIDGATSILAFAYLSVMLPAKVQPGSSDIHATESAKIQGPTSTALKDRRFQYFLAAMFPVLLVFFLEMGPLQQFMKIELAMGGGLFAYLLWLNAILVIVFEIPLNRLTGNWSYRKSLMWGASLIALGFGAMTFAHNFNFIVLTVVIWTFGEMFILPNGYAYVGRIAPHGRQGEYNGIYTMVFNLCYSLGPGLGLIALGYVPRIMWVAAFALGTVSVVMISHLDRSATLSTSGPSH